MKSSRNRFFLLIAVLSLTVVGCVEGENNSVGHESSQEMEGRLATFPDLSRSLLIQMDRAADLQKTSSIRYPFCIHTVGVTRDTSVEENVKQWSTQAMNKWIAPLVGRPQWKITHAEAYRVSPSGTTCPSTDNGIRVYEIRIMDLDGADNSWLYMRMGDWGIHPTVVVHEMGHGIGLADLYEGFWGEPLDQPDAVMNNAWEMDGKLTEDDIAGVRFVWDRIRGAATGPCPEGYVRGQLEEPNGNVANKGYWGETYCVKDENASGGGDNGDGGDDNDTCVDNNRNCDYWASVSECDKNPGYMLVNCCASCRDDSGNDHDGGGDNDTCVDNNRNCDYWASVGECDKNPGYMLVNCCASCRDDSGNDHDGGGDDGSNSVDPTGTFQRSPVLNNWHFGTIEKTNSGYRWSNKAGVSWNLVPDFENNRLLTQSDCPYYNSNGGREFKLVLSGDKVTGFRFLGELYSK